MFAPVLRKTNLKGREPFVKSLYIIILYFSEFLILKLLLTKIWLVNVRTFSCLEDKDDHKYLVKGEVGDPQTNISLNISY